MQPLSRAALLDTPLTEAPFVVFDLESTGLNPEEDRICEVALIRLQGGRTVDSFESLIRSDRLVTPGAFAVNRISTTMLLDAPAFVDIAPDLLRAIGNGVIVAHNAAFDVCFLDAELARVSCKPLRNVVVDTLPLARHFMTHDRYNLAALAQRLGLSQPSHRAMTDVQALVGVFQYLLEQMEPLGVATVADLLRAQNGLLPGDPDPVAPPMILEALRDGRRLRIGYRTNGGDPIPRDIWPIELKMSNGLPRLIAYCFLRNSQRTFYLDRIADLQLVPDV